MKFFYRFVEDFRIFIDKRLKKFIIYMWVDQTNCKIWGMLCLKIY